MALQIHADGAVAYDSRLEDYTLLGLKTTTGLNKGGTAEIVMPPGHPAYNMFTSYKTLVTLRENGALRFRGRALYPADDFYNIRTIMCEGERCFLRDAIMRPYLYTADPASIFSAAVTLYNAETPDPEKQFALGVCTVTDANNYIRLESESAETFADFFDKLVERCGGYITFSDAPDGSRAINWLAEIDSTSGQIIEFGENLLEFARSGQSADLATAVLPYGAQLEDGSRVTIEIVNNGQDYIQDDEAVALRGRIMASVVWDDVTDPANLLTKAREWLDQHKLLVVSLELTAADLSRMDQSIDSYQVGDRVEVLSKPHGVDGFFQLTERTIDWLAPDGGSITLGRTVTSLTGADVIAAQSAARSVSIVKNAVVKVAGSSGDAAAQVEERLSNKIQQLADSIELEVSGGLGNVAAIRLTVDGESYTEALYLDNVRQAFADDSSAVTISAGTITFNSGTLVVNSDNFKVDSTGKITATGAQINGIMTTENGSYKAQMDGGGLDLYWQGNLCGTINTKYWTGATTEGICLRIEEDGHYIMFCSPNADHATGYEVDYYLNYGWSTNYDEKHIFQTSARFLDKLYWSNAYARGLFMYEDSYIKACEDDGTATEEMLGFDGTYVKVGSVGCATMLRGTTVYLKNTSTTVTSDRNAKNSIEALPEAYEAMLDALEPVRFKYNEGTGGRYHVGYIAQDVAAALETAGLSTADFAGYVDIEGSGELGLMYDEFVALLHLKIKRLEQRLAALAQ